MVFNGVGLKTGDKVTCRYAWGAFAEYIVCKPFYVKILPDNFPLIETSLIEVLSGVIHTAELGQINQTKNVLLMGQLRQAFNLRDDKTNDAIRVLVVRDRQSIETFLTDRRHPCLSSPLDGVGSLPTRPSKKNRLAL